MKALIAIGVDKVDGAANLPTLSAAASGAVDIAAWAATQGYSAVSITDTDMPVTVKAIRDAIDKIVQPHTFSQLVIYFAGHGILKAADTEMWLLSDAANDPNAAVNLVGSVRLARKSGIPHLVFISDACRSLAADPRLSEVTGSNIFPISLTPQRPPEVDLFYATLPGEVSWEVPADQAAKRYNGIFTKTLLQALREPVASLIETVPADTGANITVISSRTLKPWLEEHVPDAIADVNIRLTQFPEVRVESQRPKYLVTATLPPPPSPLLRGGYFPDFGTPNIGIRSRLHDLSFEFPPEGYHYEPGPEEAPPPAPVATRQTGMRDPAFVSALNLDIEAIRNTRGRHSFETRTGFSIAGTAIRNATLDNRPIIPPNLFQEDGQWHIRVDPHSNSTRSLIVQFEDGTGTCLGVFEGYIGTVVVENGRVVNVNYTPSQTDVKRYAEFQSHREEIEQNRAQAAAAARRGIFRPTQFNYLDPTLALYSAYAYAQSDRAADLDSIPSRILQNGVVPFDVALLTGHPGDFRVAPFCPMLTQGWMLLDDNIRVPDNVRTAARYLIPALWTTLTEKGIEALRA